MRMSCTRPNKVYETRGTKSRYAVLLLLLCISYMLCVSLIWDHIPDKRHNTLYICHRLHQTRTNAREYIKCALAIAQLWCSFPFHCGPGHHHHDAPNMHIRSAFALFTNTLHCPPPAQLAYLGSYFFAIWHTHKVLFYREGILDVGIRRPPIFGSFFCVVAI